MTNVIVTRVIAAALSTVYSFFSDIERWTSWQGVDGEIDPQAGGILCGRAALRGGTGWDATRAGIPPLGLHPGHCQESRRTLE